MQLVELDVGPWDVVISGDVDEIPHPAAIRRFRLCSVDGLERGSRGNVIILEATMLMYHTRCLASEPAARGGRIGGPMCMC